MSFKSSTPAYPFVVGPLVLVLFLSASEKVNAQPGEPQAAWIAQQATASGLVIAAIISALVPDDYFADKLGRPILAMVIMMFLGIPVYVCATASVPVAAVLLLKGLTPGGALSEQRLPRQVLVQHVADQEVVDPLDAGRRRMRRALPQQVQGQKHLAPEDRGPEPERQPKGQQQGETRKGQLQRWFFGMLSHRSVSWPG